METAAAVSVPTGLSAAALAEWLGHVEQVLQGIAHSLNNRAGALSAVLELTSDPEATEGGGVAGTLALLRSEVERLGELSAAVRSLGAPRAAAAAVLPVDAVVDALAILELHAGLGDRTVAIDATAAPPVRVERAMFVRALVALGAGAAAEATHSRVVLTADGDWLVVRAEPTPITDTGVGPLVTELARGMGGGPLSDGSGFRLPTLATLRRREAR